MVYHVRPDLGIVLALRCADHSGQLVCLLFGGSGWGYYEFSGLLRILARRAWFPLAFDRLASVPPRFEEICEYFLRIF